MRYWIAFVLLVSTTAFAEHYWRIVDVRSVGKDSVGREYTAFVVEVYVGTAAGVKEAFAAADASTDGRVERPQPVFRKEHAIPATWTREQVMALAATEARAYHDREAAKAAAAAAAQVKLDAAEGTD